MTPEQEKKLAKLYRDLAEQEEGTPFNAVDETCEVRFVSAQKPIAPRRKGRPKKMKP